MKFRGRVLHFKFETAQFNLHRFRSSRLGYGLSVNVGYDYAFVITYWPIQNGLQVQVEDFGA